MAILKSILPPGCALDPDQGGTGISLTGVAAGLILVTDGADGFLLSSPLVKAPVTYASAAVLPNAPNYLNGAAGVGSTLTATVNAALVVDGFTPTVGMRIGVINQAATLQNGIYTVTVVGTAGTKWVLTRAIDCDTSTEILPGMSFNVAAGTVNAGDTFVLTTPAPITVGTTGLVFAQGSPTGYLLAANNLSDVANATTAIANLGVINGVLTGFVAAAGDVAATDTILQGLQKVAPGVLTGYVSGAGVVAATDTVLQAIQKLNGNIAGSGTSWASKTVADTGYTAVAGQALLIDTSGGAVTINLPAAPAQFAVVGPMVDAAGTFSTNNLTIGRSALKIMGLAQDMTVNQDGARVSFVYDSAANGWRITAT